MTQAAIDPICSGAIETPTAARRPPVDRIRLDREILANLKRIGGHRRPGIVGEAE